MERNLFFPLTVENYIKAIIALKIPIRLFFCSLTTYMNNYFKVKYRDFPKGTYAVPYGDYSDKFGTCIPILELDQINHLYETMAFWSAGEQIIFHPKVWHEGTTINLWRVQSKQTPKNCTK